MILLYLKCYGKPPYTKGFVKTNDVQELMFRGSDVQELMFRSSDVQEFRCSGVQRNLNRKPTLSGLRSILSWFFVLGF